MTKTISLIRRKAGIDRAELFRVWEREHAPNVVRAYEPVRYVITHFDARPDGSDPPYDGMVELTYRDQAHLDRVGLLRKDFQAADGFRERMLNWDSFVAARVTPHVIADGPSGEAKAKRVVVVRRAEHVSGTDYRKHLLEIHGPNIAGGIAQTPDCLRYVIDTAEAADAPFDAVAHYYWRSAEAMEEGLTGTKDDGIGQVSAPGGITILAGHELVIVA